MGHWLRHLSRVAGVAVVRTQMKSVSCGNVESRAHTRKARVHANHFFLSSRSVNMRDAGFFLKRRGAQPLRILTGRRTVARRSVLTRVFLAELVRACGVHARVPSVILSF